MLFTVLRYIVKITERLRLLARTAIATQAMLNHARVIGCEPEGANNALRSFISGVIQPSENLKTIADRLFVSLGTINYEIIKHMLMKLLRFQKFPLFKQ